MTSLRQQKTSRLKYATGTYRCVHRPSTHTDEVLWSLTSTSHRAELHPNLPVNSSTSLRLVWAQLDAEAVPRQNALYGSRRATSQDDRECDERRVSSSVAGAVRVHQRRRPQPTHAVFSLSRAERQHTSWRSADTDMPAVVSRVPRLASRRCTFKSLRQRLGRVHIRSRAISVLESSQNVQRI